MAYARQIKTIRNKVMQANLRNPQEVLELQTLYKVIYPEVSFSLEALQEIQENLKDCEKWKHGQLSNATKEQFDEKEISGIMGGRQWHTLEKCM